MGATTTLRKPNYALTANGSRIAGKDFSLAGVASFCLQLFLKDTEVGFDGTFQLTVSNEDESGTNHVPVEDIAGVSYKIHVTGNTQKIFFIFAGEGQGVASAQWLNLRYAKTAAAVGTLEKIIFSANTQ